MDACPVPSTHLLRAAGSRSQSEDNIYRRADVGLLPQILPIKKCDQETATKIDLGEKKISTKKKKIF